MWLRDVAGRIHRARNAPDPFELLRRAALPRSAVRPRAMRCEPSRSVASGCACVATRCTGPCVRCVATHRSSSRTHVVCRGNTPSHPTDPTTSGVSDSQNVPARRQRCVLRVSAAALSCAVHVSPSDLDSMDGCSHALRVVYGLLSVACCVLHVACCMLRVACCMLPFACCRLHVACCALQVVCCALQVACCMLRVAGCMLRNLIRPDRSWCRCGRSSARSWRRRGSAGSPRARRRKRVARKYIGLNSSSFLEQPSISP
jgi:hypothetical protein